MTINQARTAYSAITISKKTLIEYPNEKTQSGCIPLLPLQMNMLYNPSVVGEWKYLLKPFHNDCKDKTTLSLNPLSITLFLVSFLYQTLHKKNVRWIENK